MRRVMAILLLGWVLAVLAAPPVSAAGGLCNDENGQPIPNCTVEDPDPGSGTSVESDIPGGFIALMVLVVLAGVAVTGYKVSMARGMARESGLDPDRATAMTLLDDGGLSATYLASSLRPQAPAPSGSPTGRTVTERLAELDALLAEGKVTRPEYDERRAAILGSL